MNRTLAVITVLALFASSGAFAQTGANAPAAASAPPSGAASPNAAGTPSAPAAAQTAAAPSPDSIATLRIFKSQGADINYLGHKYGLDGWLVSKGQGIQVLYTTPNGDATVVGLMYGPNAEVVTGDQLTAARQKGLSLTHTTFNFDSPQSVASSPQADASSPAVAAPSQGDSPSQKLLNEMAGSTYLTFGPATAPVLYAFMDPQCHYCHDYWTQIVNTYLPQGKLQIRIVPVAILGAASEDHAEKILASPDPAKAWAQLESGDLSGLPATITDKQSYAAKLDANRRLMMQWKMTGTPGTVYQGKDGKVKLIYGIPDNVASVVNDLGTSQP